MLEYLSHPIFIILNSFIFGIFTKLADLTNEHQKRFFKQDKVIFGVLWGIFGSLTIIGNNLVGTFYLAIIIHWIIRKKIDHLNHGLAVIIIGLTFIYQIIYNNYILYWTLLIIILIDTLIFGFLRYKRIIKKSPFTELTIHIFIILAFLSIYNSAYRIVFASFLFNTIGYQIIKTTCQEPYTEVYGVSGS